MHMGEPTSTVTGNIASGEREPALCEVAEDLSITSSISDILESSSTTDKGGGNPMEAEMTSTDVNICGTLESLNGYPETVRDAEHGNNASSGMYQSQPTSKRPKHQDTQNHPCSTCTKSEQHQGWCPILCYDVPTSRVLTGIVQLSNEQDIKHADRENRVVEQPTQESQNEGCPLGDSIYPTGIFDEPLHSYSCVAEPDLYIPSLGVSPESSCMGDDHPSIPLDYPHQLIHLRGGGSSGSVGSQDFSLPQYVGKENSENWFPLETEPECPSAFGEKRPVKRLASGHESDDEYSRSSKERKKSEDSVETNQRSLACPFYKHDSYKYHDCRYNVLRRIKDVKQHIVRKHQKPSFYCPVCFETFDDATLRDSHIQERGCASQSDPIYDGISADQKKALGQYSGRGKTLECQWNDVWQVIFPKLAPPESPYLGNYREEIIPQLRDFWNERRDQITSRVLQKHPVDDQHTTVIYHLMEETFDRFEEESSKWIPPRGSANRYEPKANSPQSQSSELANWHKICAPDVSGSLDQQLSFGPSSLAMNIPQLSGYAFNFDTTQVLEGIPINVPFMSRDFDWTQLD